MVIVLYPDLAVEIKSINKDVLSLAYENVMAAHPFQGDWNYTNNHEEWFMHSKDGYPLKNNGWCWYLMDPASGWRHHVANRVRKKFAEYPGLDGAFVDDCWPTLYDFKWHVNIHDETSFVKPDGHTVHTNYKIWKGPARSKWCKEEVGVHGVFANPKRAGRDYFRGGSYNGRDIKLGTKLPPGTRVYLDYAAKDQKIFKPKLSKVVSFQNDVRGMLHQIKTTLSKDKLLISNSGNVISYLDTVDGMMLEGFLSGTRTGDYDYPSLMQWKADLNKQQKTVARKRMFMAHSGTSGRSKNKAAIRKKAMFCYASHLLVFDPVYSSFGFTVHGKPFAWYPEWNASLGEPTSNYYLLEQGSPGVNLIVNSSFEQGLKHWTVFKKGPLGTSVVSRDEAFDGAKSVHFISSGHGFAALKGELIPVEPNTGYRLSARIKGQSVVGGNSWWQKMGVWGWWYDKYKNRLGQFSLLFPDSEGTGSFDWIYLLSSKKSPTNAKFFRIDRAGFVKGSSGEGWIDDLKLIKDVSDQEYIVYARDFSNGLVLLNMGTGNHTVRLSRHYHTLDGNRVQRVSLDAHQAIILLNKNPKTAS
jgi:hypothetical protein